jgi:hypothetical protein
MLRDACFGMTFEEASLKISSLDGTTRVEDLVVMLSKSSNVYIILSLEHRFRVNTFKLFPSFMVPLLCNV